MKLKEGIMTNAELAEWFGVTTKTFCNCKKKKLEELKLFANFYEEYGKVYITSIIEPDYNKQQKKTLQKVINKVDKVWSKDGLDSCSRVGSKICTILETEGVHRSENTIIEYTRQGRNELYGKPFSDGGKLGTCSYLWCKRDPATGNYSMFTPEEEKIKNDLLKKYFGDTTEKQIMVETMIQAGEIKKSEAWGVLQELTNMNKDSFLVFLNELQAKINSQVVRGTLVERNAFALASFETKDEGYLLQ